MVDTNQRGLITKHVHFDQQGIPLICPPLQESIGYYIAAGYREAEILLKLNPDGSFDFSDAVHLFWKDKSKRYVDEGS